MKVVFCPVKGKEVKCRRDGNCEGIRDLGLGVLTFEICPVHVKALDVALNC